MAYSSKIIDHYKNPRNVGSLDQSDPRTGTGLVGSPACGDVMKLDILVEDGVIVDAKFKTFGCGSAIASSSLATELLRNTKIEDAVCQVTNARIAEELQLPPVKLHCSVLAEEAIQEAIKNYQNKQAKTLDSEGLKEGRKQKEA